MTSLLEHAKIGDQPAIKTNSLIEWRMGLHPNPKKRVSFVSLSPPTFEKHLQRKRQGVGGTSNTNNLKQTFVSVVVSVSVVVNAYGTRDIP